MHDPVSIAAIMEGKRRRRWDAIVALRREAAARGLGESLELGYWALIHDLEHASITTNLDQLAEIGVTLPDALRILSIQGNFNRSLGGVALPDG